MEDVASNRVEDGATSKDGNRAVSFIVGDEEGNDQGSTATANTQNHNHLNGDVLSHEDEKEKHDNFPGDDMKPSSGGGLDSKSSSYKDMFGLTERRKRLR